MEPSNTHIDPYLFEKQFEAFKLFVEDKSGVSFVSFASNPYTEDQESYKYQIHHLARKALSFQTWIPSDIGTGKIADSVIAAIEIPKSDLVSTGNNLVPWQSRYGEESRPHHPLYESRNNPASRRVLEECLYKLYRNEDEESSFEDLIQKNIFGKTYPLIAYLFFLKDRTRFLPISPNIFFSAFQVLGVDFKISKRCSWEHYSQFIELIAEVKTMLSEQLNSEVSLLDAHSFVFMLAKQMQAENKLADTQEYRDLPETERDAMTKARIGQGRFRSSLLEYWSCCAVTGLSEPGLLKASHIKPWKMGTATERLDLYNGLLLSPEFDACFDFGYISFEENGKIIISERLNDADVERLGLHSDMKLRQIESHHIPYLKFHRDNIFK